MFKGKKDVSQIIPLLQTTGHPIRMQILQLLINQEQCVCTIYSSLNLRQNLISHHLWILKKNHLVKSRKKGKWVYYSIHLKSIQKIINFLYGFTHAVQKKHPTRKC